MQTSAPTTPDCNQNAARAGLHSVQRFVRRIWCGDNCEILGQMPPESVDLVVTSPPYDDMRTYGGHAWDFYGVAWQLKRVLKPGGVIVWVVGDSTIKGGESLNSMRQALHFQALGMLINDTMVWRKYLPGLQGKRYTHCWEYMLVVSKGEPKTFNPLMRANKTSGMVWRKNQRAAGEDEKTICTGYKKAAESSIEENVWDIPVGGTNTDPDGGVNGIHPAMFPIALAKRHIASWSNPGDIVLDPFSGSGTTCKAAKELEREWIGIEINPKYVEASEQRLLQSVLQLETCDNSPNDELSDGPSKT